MWLGAGFCVVIFAQVCLVSSQCNTGDSLLRQVDNRPLNVGDSCRLNSGGTGVCTLTDNCDQKMLEREPGETVVCASGIDVIVCCPPGNTKPKPKPHYIPPQARPQSNRGANSSLSWSKSYQKCEEYSKLRCRPPNPKPASLIIVGGGDEVESPAEFPHMALLGYGDPANATWNCGGSLISEQYIITAAHCTRFIDGTEVSIAHLGFLNIHNRNEFKRLQKFRIVEVISHPERYSPRKYNDIVLLKLDRPVMFTDSVMPACLHEEYAINTNKLIATGWGDTDHGSNTGSAQLMKVTIQLTTFEECSKLYTSNRNLNDGIRDAEQFCAGAPNKDTCQGDSGGPLQIYRDDFIRMPDIIGITSFGGICRQQPGVYTRISHYVPWIESVVWP